MTWLLLVLLPACAAALIVAWVDNRSNPLLRQRYLLIIAGEMALLLLALSLNRQGRFTLASRLTVVAAIIGPWSSTALDPSILRGNYVPLIYTVLAVILGSMLLSARATVLIAAAELAALLSLSILGPPTPTINWPSLWIFVAFISALSVVANVVSHQDMEQIEDQRQRLLKRESELRLMSVRDPLTGLFNRRYLEETLERELHRASRESRSFGLVLLDVDHLKEVNDSRGHAAGDVVLREIGELLAGQVRKGDAACRYGGDEFVLILSNATRAGTEMRAEEIRAGVKSLRDSGGKEHIGPLSFSIGIAVFPDHGRTRKELLGAADDALYRAKREGRGRLRVAE